MPTDSERRHARRGVYIAIGAAVVVMLALTAAWHWTPLKEYAQPQVVAHWLRAAAKAGWMPVLVGAAFVAASAVMFPNTALCFGVILALGPLPGFVYATAGSLLAALVGYVIGRRYGADKVNQLEIRSIDRLTAELRRGGVAHLSLIRLLPLAPFPVVSIMAGAARVSVVAYLIGTLVGVVPGNALFALFGRQVRRMIANPSPTEIAVAAAILVLGTLAMWQLRRLTAPSSR